MKTRVLILPLLAACLAPDSAIASTFGWTGGKLKDFLDENAIHGLSFPLKPPNELFINSPSSVTVDLTLANESVVNAARGLIGIADGYAISNAAMGEFNIGNASQIFASGDPELSVFENEGVVRKSGDATTTISARFVNYNGGTVEAGADTILRLSNADIRQLSVFGGLGQVRVSGFVSGEIHSDQSLVIGSTTGSSLTTADNVFISGAWRWTGPILGNWTNLGHVRGSTVNEGTLGAMRGGARFINEGTLSGVVMEMEANDDGLEVEDRTTFVNNGVLEFDGPDRRDSPHTKIRTSSVIPLQLVNNGVLKIIDSHDIKNQINLGAVLFENRGTIDVVAGTTFNIGFGAAPGSSRDGPTDAVFLNGTQFTGAGTTRVTGSNGTRHEFSGVIFSENLQLGDGFNTPSFDGIGATLLGTAAWRSGTMTGAWFSGATLNLGADSSGAPALAGTLTNTGIIQQFNRLHLLPNATLVNFGLYAMTGGVSNDIVGSADSVVDTISNLGQFHTAASGFNTLRDMRFVNHGLMQITSNTILFNSVLENYGSLIGTGELRLNGGSTFLNEGTIAPGLSPGTLTIRGDFTNGPNGVIEIEMASATVFDVLRVTGDLNLGGTLRIKLLDGYMPDLHTPFTFLSYASFTGAFDNIELEGFSGAEFNLTYRSSSFGLAFASIPAPVPLPPAVWLFGSALGCLAWRHRRGVRSRSATRA